jgi:hypothetical protein
MVTLRSFTATGTSTRQALAGLAGAIDETSIQPHIVCAFYDSEIDDEAIFDFVRSRWPAAALLGGTSCNGVMSDRGLERAGSIGMLLLEDAKGSYGTAAVKLQADVAGCAEHALHAALANAGCAGELPELIWIYQAPGREEAVIEGLRQVVGDRCPIIGGSSADNDIAGKWRQLGPDGSLTDGLVVGVFFSSGGIGFGFQGGYEPTGARGIVTRVGFDPAGHSGPVTKAAGRLIISIDNEPAAEVYNRWVGGILSAKLAEGGSILMDTTMCPLAIDAGKIEDVTHYRLIHPERITPGGALSTFAMIEEGAQLHSMRGNKARLIARAGKVASAAAASLPGGIADLAGGLIVYCAGCMLAVGDQMPEVAKTIADSFNSMPFIGCFTFGEQGLMLDKNVHGNLMISAIAFGK